MGMEIRSNNNIRHYNKIAGDCMKDFDCVITGAEKLKHHKLTMQKLVELKDKKVWDSIYIKCHLCGQFKPAKDGILIESDMTVDVKDTTLTIKQVCEVVCSDCDNLMGGGLK